MNAFTTLTLFAVAAFFTSMCSNDKTPGTDASNERSVSIDEAKDLVNQLEKEGYYKYASPDDIDTLKKDFVYSLANFGFISSVYKDGNPTSLDYRHYSLDGETLFEEGGFIQYLSAMKPTFEKMGLKMEITNHIEVYDMTKKVLNHSVTVNGKDYIIFRNFAGYGWGEAAQRYAEILNDQMEQQGKDERLFLTNGGNDGAAFFMTDAQYKLLEKADMDMQSKPLRVAEWCAFNSVDPKNYLKD